MLQSLNQNACYSCSPSYPSYFSGDPPGTSYVYKNSSRQNYLFEDPKMERYSFLPSFEINGKKVIFTINTRPAIYYQQTFVYSISDLFKKIQSPQNLDSELLEKIAIIINFLSGGKEYKYLKGTAKQVGEGLTFKVLKNCTPFQVTLPSLKKENSTAIYEENDDFCKEDELIDNRRHR